MPVAGADRLALSEHIVFDDLMAVNLRAPFLLARRVLPEHLPPRGDEVDHGVLSRVDAGQASAPAGRKIAAGRSVRVRVPVASACTPSS